MDMNNNSHQTIDKKPAAGVMGAPTLYNALFMDHVNHPDYRYSIDNPTLSHEGVNPSCGDELTF